MVVPGKNNRTFYLILICILGLAACTDRVHDTPEPPEDLIPRDTMVSIFVDLRLMDAVVNYEQRLGNANVSEINYYLHNSIMEKYAITREQFERSFTYYQHDLEVIDGIYADAITRMTKMKSLMEQSE
jgi:hypothetical protein